MLCSRRYDNDNNGFICVYYYHHLLVRLAMWDVTRPRDPQGLAGIVSSPIMHKRAFFMLSHHFYTEKTAL